MRMITHRWMPVLFSAALISLPLAANAADDIEAPPGERQPPGQQTPGQQAPSQQPPGTGSHEPGAAFRPDIDEDKIEKFASAFSDVMEIQETYSGRLEATNDTEQAQALQQRAQNEMIDAVENNGLTVPEYNEVVAMMEQDPALRERIFRMAN